MREVLVTGGRGQLGQALQRAHWPDGWRTIAPLRDELDLADSAALDQFVRSRQWAAVINAAAYTAVDRAEEEPVEAWRSNALVPAALAAACRRANSLLIHLSTDYVFDGSAAGARDVGDTTGPIGVYGASKLGGELAVRSGCPRHVIIRTSWLVSPYGSNFIRTMLRLGQDRARVGIVADQHGSPTSANDLAAAIVRIAVGLDADPAAPAGTYHFSNEGATDWHEFAAAIFAGSAARGGPSAAVDAISTADFPTAARRPANSLLSSAAITRDWDIRPRPWRDALEDILDELIGPKQ
ncbi:dTDP-4-dehydrorhamnose reductase [Sphingomonas sp.]|uniref:dTDP-4-dehydrorhamnose reductase n=1 Tax=Sphingomonas sp. TaxID=28214 RepID=UPI00286AC50D|nr:dTDP-4-dehydrorhamnose reductase [Sphingomonas sp.]